MLEAEIVGHWSVQDSKDLQTLSPEPYSKPLKLRISPETLNPSTPPSQFWQVWGSGVSAKAGVGGERAIKSGNVAFVYDMEVCPATGTCH